MHGLGPGVTLCALPTESKTERSRASSLWRTAANMPCALVFLEAVLSSRKVLEEHFFRQILESWPWATVFLPWAHLLIWTSVLTRTSHHLFLTSTGWETTTAWFLQNGIFIKQIGRTYFWVLWNSPRLSHRSFQFFWPFLGSFQAKLTYCKTASAQSQGKSKGQGFNIFREKWDWVGMDRRKGLMSNFF